MTDLVWGTRKTRRILLMACLVLASPVVAPVVGGGTVTANTTQGMDARAASTASTNPPLLAFSSASTGSLTTYNEDQTTTSLDVTTDVSGPMHDVDGDGALEAVYVDGSGQLHLVDQAGETEALAATNAPSSKTMFAVGDLDGDGTLAVFYPNTADSGYLYKVEYGHEPTRVVTTSAKAALGVTDYDADGDTDLVFLGGSSTIKFYDGSVHSTGYSSIGSNNGIGVGAPADVDGDGVPRVPIVDGSNNPALIAADGSKTALKSGSAVKAPIAGADVTGDATLELVYVNKNGYVAYTTLGDSTDTVTTADGTKLDAAKKVGVVAAAAPPAPTISKYTVSNPEQRNIRISFNSTQELADIRIDITRDGTTVATLTEANVTETSSDGTYHYSATYTAEMDGTYTATLENATDADGNTASSTPSATVSVDAPPAIGNYTVTNPAERELVVSFSSSERLPEIAVTIDGPTSTTLTEADFEESSTATGYQYQATYEFDQDGTYSATLQTATDDAGNDGASGESESVTIETPDPRVTDVTIVDLTNQDGVVKDDDRVRITATVEGDHVASVRSDLSALGAGTVRLVHTGGNSYQATAIVDGENASRSGSFTYTVRAENTYNNTDTRRTEPLLLDTVAPVANTGPNVTVQEDTKVVFDASASEDNIAIARYVWHLGTSEQVIGTSVVHVYDEPGTYTVTLVAVDAAGNRDTATRTITVTDVPGEPTTQTTTPSADGNETTRVVEVVRLEGDSDANTTDGSTKVVRFQNVPIETIQFTESPPNGTLRVERLSSLPSNVSDYPGTVIWPLQITISNGTKVPATIVFSVDRDTLGNLPPKRVTLLRYTDEGWQRLDTSVVSRGSNTVSYAAKTTGFSYYAIAVPPQANGSTVTETNNSTSNVETAAKGTNDGGSLLWPLFVLVVLLPLVGVWGYRQGYFDAYVAKARDMLD